MIGLEGATCNTALIPEMEEIGANILLAEHIGRALVVGSEPADRLDVDVPGPLGKAGKPHVVDHTLTQRGHGRSPFGFKRQDLCPGTDQIPQHAVLNDYAFYGEAVQSKRWHGVQATNRTVGGPNGAAVPEKRLTYQGGWQPPRLHLLAISEFPCQGKPVRRGF